MKINAIARRPTKKIVQSDAMILVVTVNRIRIQPHHEVQRLEHDVGNAIAIGCFQSVVDKTWRRQ